jgi:hypothetical protein
MKLSTLMSIKGESVFVSVVKDGFRVIIRNKELHTCKNYFFSTKALVEKYLHHRYFSAF